VYENESESRQPAKTLCETSIIMKRHWTPRYVFNRLNVIVYQRMHAGHPWLTAQAISLLDGLLRPIDVGLEWGSGRSTAWFGQRISALTSIEHDALWGESTRL
jgi:hypothetical protein